MDLLKTITRKGPAVSNGKLATTLDRSKSSIGRDLRHMDLPPDQKSNPGTIDSLNFTLHRVTSRAYKTTDPHIPYRRDRRLYVVSQLPHDLGARVVALHVERLGPLTSKELVGHLVEDLPCAPGQAMTWLRLALDRHLCREVHEKGQGPHIIGTGAVLPEREQVSAEAQRYDRLATISEDAALSSREASVLSVVMSHEASDRGFCDAKIEYLELDLGIPARTVQAIFSGLQKTGRLLRYRYAKGHRLKPGQILSTKPLDPQQVLALTIRVAQERALAKQRVQELVLGQSLSVLEAEILRIVEDECARSGACALPSMEIAARLEVVLGRGAAALPVTHHVGVLKAADFLTEQTSEGQDGSAGCKRLLQSLKQAAHGGLGLTGGAQQGTADVRSKFGSASKDPEEPYYVHQESPGIYDDDDHRPESLLLNLNDEDLELLLEQMNKRLADLNEYYPTPMIEPFTPASLVSWGAENGLDVAIADENVVGLVFRFADVLKRRHAELGRQDFFAKMEQTRQEILADPEWRGVWPQPPPVPFGLYVSAVEEGVEDVLRREPRYEWMCSVLPFSSLSRERIRTALIGTNPELHQGSIAYMLAERLAAELLEDWYQRRAQQPDDAEPTPLDGSGE